jgi:glucose/arabinose dehydrogenase
MKTGALWIGDVGQSEWEEADIGKAGANYGWKITEGFHCHHPASSCNQDGLTGPVTEYSHDNGACSITGGYVYRGEAIPALDGYYLYADYCSGIVQAFAADGAAAGSKPAVTTLREHGPEISSFAEDLSGELYLLDFDGSIEKVAP